MTIIPPPIDHISALIDKSHENAQSRPRSHMGISTIGHHCKRWVWLSFRWAIIEKFEGRILRLFRRGQNEEATMIADLQAAGMVINSTQNYVDFGCHVSGSIDGVIESGVPISPNKKHVLEIKTHSLKSFKELKDKGVQTSKPQHYAQMQGYMLGMGIDRAMYAAVCKDNDELYFERVKLDEIYARELIQEAQSLAMDYRIPPPIGKDESWFQCKFCAAKDFCYNQELIKEKNCRTCNLASPQEDSTWYCQFYKKTIPLDFQYKGCENHQHFILS